MRLSAPVGMGSEPLLQSLGCSIAPRAYFNHTLIGIRVVFGQDCIPLQRLQQFFYRLFRDKVRRADSRSDLEGEYFEVSRAERLWDFIVGTIDE